MNINPLIDHGRSAGQIKQEGFPAHEKAKGNPAANGLKKGNPLMRHKPVSDRFEKAEVAKKGPQTTNGQAVKAEGLNISFQFDLFYELSTKVEAKMGQSGATRFVELSASVAETFESSFSLKIDAVGTFMHNTEKSLEISPETTNRFFDAVEGLANFDAESLETFLQETKNFFAELEEIYGPADGAFDQIRSQMETQANDFFANVQQVREEAIGAPEEASQLEQTAPATNAAVTSPIELTYRAGQMIEADDYQDFLSSFAEYANKFKHQLLQRFFADLQPTYGKKITAEPADPLKPQLPDISA